MTKYAVLTTFHAAGYEKYASRMIDTFLQNWPQEVDLYVYTVKGLIKNNDARGMCQLDDPINGRKQIVVFIDSSLKFDSLIQVLAHEMIHVKQMVKGHYWFFVDEYDTDTHFWRGEQIKADYWDRPWEKEAWRKEKLLAIKFEKLFYTLLKNA
jgi:hypothetical protein